MQTGSDETAGLERLVPELAKLERLLGDATASKLLAVRDFTTDNSDLQRLEEMLAEAKAQPAHFDLLQVIRPGLWEYEDVHSNIVAWLMDPKQSHGVGQYFLKNFLFRTCRTAGKLGLSAITPARIHSIDWSKTEVRREWRYIDILILNREARFVCAIENKIFASEGISDNGISQLTWYRQTLAEEFPDFTKHLVFLDFKSGNPSENEQPYWTPENYITILELVEQSIVDKAATLSEDVRVFLRQYAATLRREIMPESDEIAKLARQIYVEHREAIELIYRHKPDYLSEMKQIFKEAIAKQSTWLLDREDSTFIRFRSVDWDCFEVQKTGTGWLPQSSALLLFQINFRDGTSNLPYLDLGLSPGSDELVREKLFDSTRQNPGLFRPRSPNLGISWVVLDAKEYILDESDYDNWDVPSVRMKIETWVSNFAANQFPRMNDIIVNCLREYEAEQQCK